VSLLYLDSSAIVKLIAHERETGALISLVAQHSDCASSALARVEVLRAVGRAGLGEAGLERARTVLEGLGLVAIDDSVLDAASKVVPRSLRSLDAIHLATALELSEELGALVSYDDRLLAAAQGLGLETLSPA